MTGAGRRVAASRRAPESSAAPATGTRPARVAVISAALLVLILAAYPGVLRNGFVNYDDQVYVTENPHVQAGLNGDSVAWAFTTTDQANWHPLTWLSHMLDVQLYGLDAGKHHSTSLILHAANALLLFLLLVRVTGALWRCAFVAALFAVHPLHVESVAWIAERKDVLSTLFWLLTLAAWLGYLGSRTAVRYALVVALYAAALMAKPMPVTLPFTLLLLDFWPLRRLAPPPGESREALPRLLLEKAPLVLMSVASCVVTFAAQRSGGSVETLQDFTFGERLANAALAYVSYLGKTLWPASLAVFYPHPHASPATWPVAAAALVLAAVTGISLRLASRAPFLAFGWLWYLGTLVPVIGLIQVGSQAMADRYTYVPLIGIFVAIAWGLSELGRRDRRTRYAIAGACAASLVALLPATRAQVGHWAGSEALYGHALAVTSDNWLAEEYLGRALFEQGKTDEAIVRYTESLRIHPGFAGGHNDLGIAFAQQGRIPEAIDQYDRALRLRPGSAEAHNNLGVALVRQGRVTEAIEQYEQALRLNPDLADACGNLGYALDRVGRRSEAIAQLERAVRLRPGSAGTHLGLGNALVGAGRVDAAIEQFGEALRLKPDSAEALNNLGLALTAANRLSEAIERFREALGVRPDFAEAHNNLGVALAHLSRSAEALEHFRQAVRLQPEFDQARANLRAAEEAGGDRP